MMAGWVRAFARGLMAVDGRMAHLLTDEQRRVLKEEHRALLEAISRSGERLKDRDAGGLSRWGRTGRSTRVPHPGIFELAQF